MNHLRLHRALFIVIVILLTGLSSGCGVYFNTFFNAKKAFNNAEKTRRSTGKGTQNDYKTAIDKCLKIIENNPNSKYYDDALYILAVSYFYTGQYSKSERRFREILANYPNSKFARESNMYLAKSRLELGEIAEAMSQFQEIFASKEYKRPEKAEAALALGTYYTTEKKYDTAASYFKSVCDSLGDEDQRKQAQIQIADDYYEEFRFNEALAAYRKVLEMKPTKGEGYHALFNAAMCSYRLQRIDDGIADLTTLMKDPLLFDSLETLQMAVAMGQELQEDLAFAEATYLKIAGSSKNTIREAEAYYRLGLMYQYNYDNMGMARNYYDKAAKAAPGSDAGRDALQRSADITKIGQFTSQIKNDSTRASQEAIDKLAATQINLAELYWFQMNKSDSAMYELRYLIDSFPNATSAPRAMITLAGMIREDEDDSVKADSILEEVVKKYPKSDDVGEAIALLGRKGTAADTGYAYIYFHKAENFLVDSNNVDSARAYYQKVIDEFPGSKYNVQARYNIIWLTDQYQSPGDSSLIFAYQEFLDSFPNATQAQEARNRLMSGGASTIIPKTESGVDNVLAAVDSTGQTNEGAGLNDSLGGNLDTGFAKDERERLYVGPEGDNIELIPTKAGPITTDEPFEFPSEAFGMTEPSIELYFQVLLDFSGKVVDRKLMNPTSYEQLNTNALKTVLSMTFDMLRIEPRNYKKWMVYKFTVQKPDYLK